jgi:hypothetical protein
MTSWHCANREIFTLSVSVTAFQGDNHSERDSIAIRLRTQYLVLKSPRDRMRTKPTIDFGVLMMNSIAFVE